MSKIFEQLLAARGLTEAFLDPKYEECVDPFLLPDMKKAVERIKRAAEQGEKVLIYGDYDVDGVTATTVMHDTLKLAGVKEVEVMLPNRFEDGYGMNKKVVQHVAFSRASTLSNPPVLGHRTSEYGSFRSSDSPSISLENSATSASGAGLAGSATPISLVITVDCGSRDTEIVQALKEVGADVIITDHHECGEELPEAVAVVNPKRKDAEAVELRGLAGVGVAFKVAQALAKEGVIPRGQEKWLLDLVLIGTICDSMELVGENRRLAKYGMLVLEKTKRPGLKELMRMAGVKTLGVNAIGFQIGPRLNAAGRMDSAEVALDLLMTRSRAQAAARAVELEGLNKARRTQQDAAVRQIEKRGLKEGSVIIEEGKWGEGVIGIIAGKLTEQYRKPSFVLTEEKTEGLLKGSGRSFGDFSLAAAIEECRDLLVKGGGHAEACGITIERKNLAEFRRRMNEYYDGLKLENQERYLIRKEDLKTEDFAEFSLELMEEMRRLEPFGPGNEEPVFLLPEVRVVEAARLGTNKQHLRLTVWDRNGRSLKLMWFVAPEIEIEPMTTADIWVTLEENAYRGVRSVEGRVLRMNLA